MSTILDPEYGRSHNTINNPYFVFAATSQFTLFTGRRYRQRVQKVELICDATYAADASNYYVLTLTDSLGQVAATWSTQTGQQGAITAGVPAIMVLNPADASRVMPAESIYQLRATKFAAASNLTVRPVVHLLTVGLVG